MNEERNSLKGIKGMKQILRGEHKMKKKEFKNSATFIMLEKNEK